MNEVSKPKKITELTLDEINKEIDQIANFEISGGGYGCPEAREADERKLRVLMQLREQKIKEKEEQNKAKNNIDHPKNYEYFVDLNRINELKEIKSSFDFKKLIKICEELNICYNYQSYLAVSMLGRTLLDHIPPIFEAKNFQEVANNYGNNSFKKSMLHLQGSLRNIADSHLHIPIRSKESLPNKVQVDFKSSLDVLLSEIIRISK